MSNRTNRYTTKISINDFLNDNNLAKQTDFLLNAIGHPMLQDIEFLPIAVQAGEILVEINGYHSDEIYCDKQCESDNKNHEHDWDNTPVEIPNYPDIDIVEFKVSCKINGCKATANEVYLHSGYVDIKE